MLTNELSMVKTMNHCSGATSFEVEIENVKKCIKSPSSPLFSVCTWNLKVGCTLSCSERFCLKAKLAAMPCLQLL